MAKKLEGQVAVVTGASKGIGAAIAEHLADLGRDIEVVTDMTKSRLAGFHEYQPTLRSFLDLFARLRKERIIPA
jgi:NAD(P)-dependent dehydrogenase (short-subunit alcohol dehydrogenase family)